MHIKPRGDIAGTTGKRTRPGGFTLVEVMVGAMLLMFAMAGLVPFFVSALNQSTAVRYKSSATNIARERMEQIRQLDYREITSADHLADLFGNTETLRDVIYNVVYRVKESAYGEGVLKEVTVTVGWTAPPRVTAASLTTMIHQQFVGPRVSRLEIGDTIPDPAVPATPFQCLMDDYEHPLSIHIAEADWGLVLDNLDVPGMTPTPRAGVYARLNLVDANGTALPLGDVGEDYKITGLTFITDAETDKVTQVYFPYTLDSGDIPDGYWEVQALVFNQYDEPGNVWRLRTRVENGPPAAPAMVVAVPQPGDESVSLYWSGGAERDRDHYVVERRKWDWLGSLWGTWYPIGSAVDPNATSLLDEGSASAPEEDPWGSVTVQNMYQYRVWAEDIAGNIGPPAIANAAIPDVSSTTTTTLITETTTTVSSTTTTLGAQVYTVKVVNQVNKAYSLLLEDENPATSDINTSIGKKATLLIENLPAGNYKITATAEGRPTVVATFSLSGPVPPEPPLVLTIL